MACFCADADWKSALSDKLGLINPDIVVLGMGIEDGDEESSSEY